MKSSSRVASLSTSVTLKLNEKAVALAEEGNKVYNLTAGQLPYKPDTQLVDEIKSQVAPLKSYQYSPVRGYNNLREKIKTHVQNTRKISFDNSNCEFDSIISNGGKHSFYMLMGAILDPEDEVILLSPYWLSYPQMIKLWGGKPVTVNSYAKNEFVPSIEDIKNAITDKTKAIVINSPNNPCGIHYSPDWMKQLAQVLTNTNCWIISDEIYFHLRYREKIPTYFYQYESKLLERTFILDGISKSLSCTGLRIGYCIGPKEIINGMSKLQAQTSSGANSLIQRALTKYDWKNIDEFLKPIMQYISTNAEVLETKLEERNMGEVNYNCDSAFYFLIDLALTPYFKKNNLHKNDDHAPKIADEILEQTGVAVVPTGDFGYPNGIRLSLVSQEDNFSEAIDRLLDFLS